jgi:hypothetical protein
MNRFAAGVAGALLACSIALAARLAVSLDATALTVDPAPPVTGPLVHAGTLLPGLQRFCSATPASSSPADASLSSGTGGGLPPPSRNFVGLSNSDSTVQKVPAADTSGSAGRFAFGEVVNEAIGFFDKATGQPPCPAQTLQHFWTGTPCAINVTDAVLLYDSLAHRWVVGRAGGPGQFCIAVSHGEDPTAGWFRYRFPVALSGERPVLGVWSNSYTMAVRAQSGIVPQGNVNVAGFTEIAYQRDAMLDGRPASSVEFTVHQTPSPITEFRFLPGSAEGSHTPPGGRSPTPFVEQFRGTASRLDMWDLRVDWRQPDVATLTGSGEVPVATYTDAVPGVVQPPIAGAAALQLAPGPGLVAPVSWRRIDGRDALFGSMTTAVSSSGGTHAGFQWFELQKRRGRWTVAQQGVYGPGDGNSRWRESLTVDDRGNIGVVFNVSGPSLYPSLHYTGRLATDRPDTLRPERMLIDGGGSQGPRVGCFPGSATCGFADYNQASVDPVLDCRFWMAGEYYADQAHANVGDWTTRIGSFRFPESECERDEVEKETTP